MKNRSKKNLLLICLLLLASVQNVLLASPEQNYIVYTDGTQYAVKTDITGRVVFSSIDAATSIQWAIDNLPAMGINGGEVLIEEGNYPLTNCVTVKDNVWLHGKGASTKLHTQGQVMEAIIIQDASMAVVSDLFLYQGKNEIKATKGISLERSVNCQVLNTEVSGFTHGISNYGESSLTLINNNRANDNQTNIEIANGGGVIGRWMPLLVTENHIRGGGVGIDCNAMVAHIMDNTIAGVSGRGIYARTNSIVLSGNKLTDIGGDYAIYGNGAEFNCTYNIISNVKGGGIRTRDRWGNFTENHITNCGTVEKPAIAIHLETDDQREGPGESKVVFRNTIFNEEGQAMLEYGVKEDGFRDIIAENKIGKCLKETVLAEGENTIVIGNNEVDK